MRVLLIALNSVCSAEIPLLLQKSIRAEGHDACFITPLFGTDITGAELATYNALGTSDYRFRQRIGRRIERTARDLHPDVVLLIGSNFFVDADVLWRIKRKHSARIVIWEQNMQFHLPWQCEALPCYDGVVIMDEYLIPLMKNALCKPYFIMGGMVDPDEIRQMNLSAEEIRDYGSDVCFTGTVAANRIDWLTQLATHFDMKVWGVAPLNLPAPLEKAMQRKPMYGARKCKIYSASKIMVNRCLDTNQVHGFGVKAIEALLCGCLPCIAHSPDVERYLEPGREVVTYRDQGEMVEVIAHHLSDSSAARAIIEAGRAKALEKWSYQHVVPEFLRWLAAL